MKLSFSLPHITRKDRYEKRMLHPLREWFIGIVLFAFCVLSAAAHSAYSFVLFESVSIHTVTAVEEEAVTYNKTLVDTVLTRYQEREGRFNTLLGALPPIAPQIPEVDTQASSTEPVVEEEVGTTTPEVILGI
jgi:hypothetical protein